MTNTIEIENLNISDLDIPTDETLQEVATSCDNVATSCNSLVKDTTLQSTNTVLGSLATVAKDNTLQATNTAIAGLLADTTGQNIASAISGLANAVKPDASDIPYDSNLSVKGKIDEICTDLIQTKTYTANYTAGGNASVSLTADDFNATTPSGYTPIGISDFASQNVNVVVRGIYGRATGTNTMMALRNVSSNSVTATAYATILYIKSSFL